MPWHHRQVVLCTLSRHRRPHQLPAANDTPFRCCPMQTSDNWVQKPPASQVDVKPQAAGVWSQPQRATQAPTAPPKSPQSQSAGQQGPAAPRANPEHTGQLHIGSQHTGQQARLAAAGSPTASATSSPKPCVALAPCVRPMPAAPATLPATSIRITLEVSGKLCTSDETESHLGATESRLYWHSCL